MISFKTWNTNFFDGIFPNINNIKKDVLKKEYLSLPFLEGSNGLEIGTLNVFCGHGDSGFSVFVNTLVHEVSSKQNVSTVLISDIILKSFITEGLNKSGAQVSKTLFTVLQDFKITKKCDFFHCLFNYG